MHFSKIALLTVTMLFSMVASATIWLAGSGHKGKVMTPEADGVSIAWQCDGNKCTSQTTNGKAPMHKCKQLVKKIGKITYFTDNKGQRWSPVGNHSQLTTCNRTR